MKLTCKSVLVLLLIVSLFASVAEITSFDGTVATSGSVAVTAPIGGTASDIAFIVGQRINAGDTVATLSPTAVYATRSGTVTGIFASVGSDLDSTVGVYGAVMYLEPDAGFSIAANTEKAYDTAENKYVHVGENVYLVGLNGTSRTGTGRIVSVTGADYTVEVTDASAFAIGDTVRICRSDDYSSKSRIGQGTLSRVDPVAVTGSGSLYALYVKNGDHVNAGDKLFEVLTGTYDGLWFTGNTVTSAASGIVDSVNVAEGGVVNKGDTILTVSTADSLYISFNIPEADLGSIAVGDDVEIEFMWNEGESELIPGKVSFISYLSDSTSGEATYAARVAFAADADVRIGMTTIVYTVEKEEAEEENIIEKIVEEDEIEEGME